MATETRATQTLARMVREKTKRLYREAAELRSLAAELERRLSEDTVAPTATSKEDTGDGSQGNDRGHGRGGADTGTADDPVGDQAAA